MSADGRYVFLRTAASNLVAGYTGFGTEQLFRYDRNTGLTVVVSQAAGEPQRAGNGPVIPGVLITPNGATVAFQSVATNLVAGVRDLNARTDLFERAPNGTTTLRSPAAAVVTTTPRLATPTNAVASVTTRFVAFNGVPPLPTPSPPQVYLHDREQGTTTWISQGFAGPTTPADRPATDLVANWSDVNAGFDVFLWARLSGETRPVSHAAGQPNTAGDSFSQEAQLSADGRFVTFVSRAGNHAPGVQDTNRLPDLFVWDRERGASDLLTHPPGDPLLASGDPATAVELTSDGRFVLFHGEIDGFLQTFVYDRNSRQRELISHRANAPDVPGNQQSHPLSPAGDVVLFSSIASDLVANDINQGPDLFVYSVEP